MAYDKIINYPGSVDVGIYANLTNIETGQVWNGAAMVAYNSTNVDQYDTALTFLGGGRYGFTVPTSLPSGATYQAAFKKRAAVSDPATINDFKLPDEWEFRWGGSAESAPGPGAASWYYADQGDVQDVIGEKALILISNEPDVTPSTVDTARLQRIGELVDQLIDARMAAYGYVTPMTGMSDGTALIMKDVSARSVIWKLNEPRMLTSLSSPTARNASQIDKIVTAHRELAEMTLRRIGMRSILITADRNYAITAPAEVYIPDYLSTVPVVP
jgi:hypothetical protein